MIFLLNCINKEIYNMFIFLFKLHVKNITKYGITFTNFNGVYFVFLVDMEKKIIHLKKDPF